MPKVAVVGAGLVGRAWAIVFARAGWEVAAWDTDRATLAKLAAAIAADCAELARHGLIDNPGETAARVRVAGSLADALDGVGLVQENGPESPTIKRAIFAELDRLAPKDAILASSTSAIVASDFTAELAGRARCLVAHPVNPPHLVPLVELCGAPWTAPETMKRARAIYAGVGQVPVTVNVEVEGFVLNRLQGALLAEAFRLVGDGVISPADLDCTLKDGLGLRWSFMGPFETIELNAPGGLADYCARYTGFYGRLAADPPGMGAFAADTLAKVIAAWPHEADPERLARLTRRRNSRLAALVAHKRAQSDA